MQNKKQANLYSLFDDISWKRIDLQCIIATISHGNFSIVGVLINAILWYLSTFDFYVLLKQNVTDWRVKHYDMSVVILYPLVIPT